MSDVVYVLVESGGQYDGYWETNVAASTDHEKLQLHMWELQERRKRQSAARKEIHDAYNQYARSTPRPPRPAIKLMTDVTKAERKALDQSGVTALQQDITKQNQAENARWENDMNGYFGALYQNYIDVMTKYDLVDDIVSQDTDTTWIVAVQGPCEDESHFEIQEVPMIG